MFKKLKEVRFNTRVLIIGAFYFVGVVLQNILAVKMIGTSDINIMDCGVLISWLVFACMDIITELFDKKTAVKYFTIASVFNIFFTCVFLIAIVIPGTDATMSNALAMVLGTNWRIVVASVIAFWLGNYVNAFIMYAMRVKSKNTNKTLSFIFRATMSTLFGQFIDNMLFYLIAFAPIGIASTYELSWIAILQNVALTTSIEFVVEAFASPLTALFVKYLNNKQIKENISKD